MSNHKYKCDMCGTEFIRYGIKVAEQEHHFCCFECSRKSTSARMRQYNLSVNPMNKQGAVHKDSFPDKCRRSIAKDDTYLKKHGHHYHREVAEKAVGRKLLPGEIVHHIDGNKHNNDPSNLAVMTQSEHAKLHFTKGGDPHVDVVPVSERSHEPG